METFKYLGILESDVIKQGEMKEKIFKISQTNKRTSRTQAQQQESHQGDKHLWTCPRCNGYRRRKWTRRHEFKSSTRLIAFHIALIPLGTV